MAMPSSTPPPPSRALQPSPPSRALQPPLAVESPCLLSPLVAVQSPNPILKNSLESMAGAAVMVCAKCEKKLRKVSSMMNEGADNTKERGNRKIDENGLLVKKNRLWAPPLLLPLLFQPLQRQTPPPW